MMLHLALCDEAAESIMLHNGRDVASAERDDYFASFAVGQGSV
jgi:hypothetical protein